MKKIKTATTTYRVLDRFVGKKGMLKKVGVDKTTVSSVRLDEEFIGDLAFSNLGIGTQITLFQNFMKIISTSAVIKIISHNKKGFKFRTESKSIYVFKLVDKNDE